MKPEIKSSVEACIRVLDKNARAGYTVPSAELYPHQWLWDSCFTAIGLRHIDINRAKREILSLKRGAWKNGMLPNIIFNDSSINFDHNLWESQQEPAAPKTVRTTTITQPPMLAEAVIKIGEKLNKQERIKWFESMYKTIEDYHKWLYAERNPENNGLVIQLHPYESGLDNSPPWMFLINKQRYPWWIRSANTHSIEVIFNHLRRDVEYVPSSQRIGLKDALECFYLVRKLKKTHYGYTPIKKSRQPIMQDLVFNSIFIRANKHLLSIAEEINRDIPYDLMQHMKKTEQSLEILWSEQHRQYYSRDFNNKSLIIRKTIATFMPLYSGSISRQRAAKLVEDLTDKNSYWANYPVPSAALDSRQFRPDKYWQGPTWMNANWLIIEGLKSYGYKELAQELTRRSLDLINNGVYEYYSPLDGSPKGAKDFSWTASLAIDLAVR